MFIQSSIRSYWFIYELNLCVAYHLNVHCWKWIILSFYCTCFRSCTECVVRAVLPGKRAGLSGVKGQRCGRVRVRWAVCGAPVQSPDCGADRPQQETDTPRDTAGTHQTTPGISFMIMFSEFNSTVISNTVVFVFNPFHIKVHLVIWHLNNRPSFDEILASQNAT